MSATPVLMPQLGANEDTAVITEWLVQAGTEVSRGEQIAVVETAKATVELEAEADGFLYPAAPPGTEVAVQQPIGLLLSTPDAAEADRLLAELSADAAPAAEPSSPAGDDGPELTRRARELVAELGVDPARLPTDRIVRERDIRALAELPSEVLPTAAPERRVAIYGASQGGASLAEAMTAMGGYEVVAFLDDTPGRAGDVHAGLPVWPGTDLESLAERGVGAVATHIAIRSFRLELRDRARAAGLALPSTVHPRAYVSPSARLGSGCVIKAGAVVDTAARLGDSCIIDNGAIVPHDNVLGAAVHLAPGVSLGGDCRVGAETLVGVGAVVSPRVTIGRNVIVAPGAVVVRDVADDVVVEGSPARTVGTRRGTRG